MPGEVAPAGGGEPRRGPNENAGGTGNILFSMIRMGMFWYFAVQYLGPKKPSDPSQLMKNAVTKGEELDMWLYISEDEYFRDFSNDAALAWQESNVVYGSYKPDGTRKLTYTYYPSENVKSKNASVYAHVFFAISGFPIDPQDPAYKRGNTFSGRTSLVKFRPKPKIDLRKNLLGTRLSGEDPAAQNETASDEAPPPSAEPTLDEGGEGTDTNGTDTNGTIWVPFWKPNCTVNLVDDETKYVKGALKVPPVYAELMSFDLESGNYFPTIFFNDFWILNDKLVAVNSSVESLALELEVGTISLWRCLLYLQFDESFKLQQSYGMMEGDADNDVKRVFLEGNPVLLGITVFVSLLHSVFDFLAFKNDIQFWRANKSMEGLSARTIVMNFFCQLIILLYLCDNETSWMIIISSAVGCAIEFWKIGKAMHVTVDRSRFPYLHFKHRQSYVMNKTKEYDEIAARYLSYALYPLCIGYAIYSLMYSTHKSWYSWVLTSLTGCVYTFGFIMMCPQLFINYKLKSVAHLPWRQMTYKFLNTIVDDLFAFVIKMPLLHRLSVFRDDVVFLIYIYQRWIYPVDKKRVNEFGFGGAEAHEDAPGGESAATPLLPSPGGREGEGDTDPSVGTENLGGKDKQEKLKAGVSADGVARTSAGVRAAKASETSAGGDVQQKQGGGKGKKTR